MDDECFFIFIFRDFRPPPKYVLFIEVILYNFIRDRVVPTRPKNEDFRFSAPARPRDAPAAPRSARARK